MRAVIVSGGSLNDISLIKRYMTSDSRLIACDSGLNHVYRAGLKPDIILGDFDSVEPEILEYFKNMGIDITTYPVKKDSTDTELGIFAAEKLGADDIIILAGSGTRLDHTIANIQILLPLSQRGIRARLIDEHNIVELVTDRLAIINKKGSYISLLPLTEKVYGICSQGLEYSLDNRDIEVGTSLTVSNVITSENAYVSVREGVLISIIAND